MTARPDFTTQEAMDVYIALLRAATSRRQSDEEFVANTEKVKTCFPPTTTAIWRRCSAPRPWRIATGCPSTTGVMTCVSGGMNSSGL